MQTITDEAISKLKCAAGINKGCMLSAEETKALLESILDNMETVSGS